MQQSLVEGSNYEAVMLCGTAAAALQEENRKLHMKVQLLSANIEGINKEKAKHQEQVKFLQSCLDKFLNDDQTKYLQEQRLNQWQNESIVKALKFRFALSIHGYEYLRDTGYPLPAYSTIMRRIRSFNLDFGIFDDVLSLLRYKVEFMDVSDCFCILSFDEMFINSKEDFKVFVNKFKGEFVGKVAIGNVDDQNKLGPKIFLVLLRGAKKSVETSDCMSHNTKGRNRTRKS